MKCVLQLFSILLIVVVLLLNSSDVVANECIPCDPASTTSFVCGVDDKGVVKKFQNACALRYENCDKKTKFELTDRSLCE